jgi:predicted nucleic acid-binding protein
MPTSAETPRQGMLDTNIMILRRWIDPAELPDEMAISAITLAELSAGPHQVRRNAEQDLYDEHAERARRLEVLQRAESEFDPVPFGAEAARAFGRVAAAVIATGRQPRRRTADLMIAATAFAEGLPLFTTNPGDYTGVDQLVTVVPVTRPADPDERLQDAEPFISGRYCGKCGWPFTEGQLARTVCRSPRACARRMDLPMSERGPGCPYENRVHPEWRQPPELI